ncbi:hypothetical protein SERLA73DRAFT_165614 [Serpula lacrymans var. lacrymans S7.3]|uniref:Uncharacterized protein n=2 Tax=Serpula lacrymans var. lacrymans TaxID=341189 RepID=F8PJI7_SERL3|nr:uncharacterized protein SERLADRAFT_458551 [Serpula lacrymans var. lacrymans S7.9]EGO04125.1 hypothetical protein SERLA73DRAFT_165614 [Serpula lacrymans var. lacrymans S7.3]EGO30057.1 hypothetical protein SERLADRAFT_458551 [Serpula lacrymans var. lacrymans S7.9]
MTEYDYSPAAYERYMATHNRVSNWVSNTTQHAHKYSNPFVPSPFLSSRPLHDQASDVSTYRPTPIRSTTLPHRDPSDQPFSRPSRSRSYSQDDQKPRHRSRSHSRSSSNQKEVLYTVPPLPKPRGGRRSDSVPVVYRTYDASSGGPIYLPPPRPGQTYFVVPPPGGRVEFAQQSPQSTLKSKQQPFLKRLLGSIIPSNNGSSAKSSGKGNNGSGRRSKRRLTY